MPHGSTCYSGTKIMEKSDSAKAWFHLFASLLYLPRYIVLLTSVHNDRHPLMKRSLPQRVTTFTPVCNDLYLGV